MSPQVCEGLRKNIVVPHGFLKEEYRVKVEDEQQEAFEQLKYYQPLQFWWRQITASHLISHRMPLQVASAVYVGRTIVKEENYPSRQLTQCEHRWSIYKQELLALVTCLNKFRHFVEGNRVNLFTDHKALIYLNIHPKLSAKTSSFGSHSLIYSITA